MSRIMVLGYELPAMARGAVEARSYRTWQFVKSLLDEGHQVCLVVSHDDDHLDLDHHLSASLIYHRLNMRHRGWVATLNAIHDTFQPDGLLGVMGNSCLRLTRLDTDRPIWMDIYGDRLAEIQIAQYTSGNSRGYRNIMHYLRLTLRYGDVYSTCGTPQKFALVGQLGMAGRLNRHTTGYDLVHPVLPGALQPDPADESQQALSIRGNLVPEDAFVVLWAGGYNIWIDPDTLFSALDQAMSANPNVVFLSVGASTVQQPDNPYDQFRAKIENSPHKARYILRGWQPASDIPAYYRAADVGVSLDAYHYETLLGTRTRLIEMMNFGLPVITSLGCELSAMIRDEELGLSFPIGDATTMRDHILSLANDAELRQKMAARAQHYASTVLTFRETTRPFLSWAAKPYYAPDHEHQSNRFNLKDIEYFLRFVVRNAFWRLWALESGE